MTNAGQVTKDGELQAGDLGHGFDDEVVFVEGVEGGTCGEEGADLVRLILGDALLGDVFCEELRGECEAFVERGLRSVN